MTKAQLRRELRNIARYTVSILVIAVLAHHGITIGNNLDPLELEPPTFDATPEEVLEKSPPVVGEFLVSRVVDGDTIVVSIDSVDTTVRYIGIDTPETKDPRKQVECFGIEASARNSELVEGKYVTLTLDSSNKDRYGRLLRYVSVASGTQSIDVGHELVAGGFATAVAFEPDTDRYQTYKTAERNARSQSIGLWGTTCSK